MNPRIRKIFSLGLVCSLAISLAGCDKVSDFLKNLTNRQKQEESQAQKPSPQKVHLLEILDQEQDRIEQIKGSRTYADKNSIRNSYEAILRLDQEYQQEYTKDEAKLSASDCTEISSKHYKIMRGLPPLGNLMK